MIFNHEGGYPLIILTSENRHRIALQVITNQCSRYAIYYFIFYLLLMRWRHKTYVKTSIAHFAIVARDRLL